MKKATDIFSPTTINQHGVDSDFCISRNKLLKYDRASSYATTPMIQNKNTRTDYTNNIKRNSSYVVERNLCKSNMLSSLEHYDSL